MGKTIIISNRLPVQLQISNGTLHAIPSVGGLATGMKSVHSGGESLVDRLVRADGRGHARST